MSPAEFTGIIRRRISHSPALAIGLLAMVAGTSACGGATEGEAHKNAPAPSARVITMRLDAAMEKTADQGKGFALRDATSLGRYISPAGAKNFKTCFERDKPKLSAVEIFVVRRPETCPSRIGGAIPPEQVPAVTGMDVRTAAERLVALGYDPKHISVDAEQQDGHKAKGTHWSWKVCAQTPAAGTPFSAKAMPKVTVRSACSAD
ncbi:PASTA domain-containing protein [Streptomyces sp. SID14478]|uniref:PASTA domain-containing protein n=1 Tax=Streptomyces sp. SID14478 TaxID=2706073 RepID=UPI0013DD8547|nr:PASTA domain-containing protein [Streptomyces sp. SID14478]